MIHAIFDITGCQHADADPETIMTAMRQTADRLGCTTRAQVIEPFQPHGATCVLILAELHLTVSTWPEHQLAHIDVFTCRADCDPGHAIQPILDLLAGQVTNTQNILRTQPGNLLSPEALGERAGLLVSSAKPTSRPGRKLGWSDAFRGPNRLAVIGLSPGRLRCDRQGFLSALFVTGCVD